MFIRVKIPKTKNIIPPIKFTCLSDIFSLNSFPQRIAPREHKQWAITTDTKIISGLCFAASKIVEIWLLSPHSAKKVIEKVLK